MAAKNRRQRQAARKVANPYGTSPAENPYSDAPGATQKVPTADQAAPGMQDDQGDGNPSVDPNAGRNGTAMATLNKVAIRCFGCGIEGWVGLDKIARIGEGGKQLTCQVCKSTDLDLLDREPVTRTAKAEHGSLANRWVATADKSLLHHQRVARRMAKTGAFLPVGKMIQVIGAQKCDSCGHTIKSNVPNEQGWECPKCHEGTMQDTHEGAKVAFSEPPMGHLVSNPTPEEIMAKADAIPLPIKRLPPRQQQEVAQVVSAILGTNPGLNRTVAWKVGFKTVTGLEV